MGAVLRAYRVRGESNRTFNLGDALQKAELRKDQSLVAEV